MRWLVGLVLLVCPAAAAPAGSAYRLADPRGPHRVDWLVIAADGLADHCDALCRHREAQGLRPGIVAMGDLRAHFPGIREFLAHACGAWTGPAPKFCLIVGDHDTVPAAVREAEFRQAPGEADLATDFDYACPAADLEPRLHVGRLPADTPEALATLIRKTIDCETRLSVGDWQKTVAFVTGEGGFTPEIDRMLEQMFIKIVAPGIPAGYDIRLAYANPRSAYCPDPPAFQATALDLLNAGSLFYVYVGHGYPGGVDRIRHAGKAYRVLDSADAEKIAVAEGLPVMFVIACSTGHFDGTDCVGEVFLGRPAGPVAFVGGSRVTQPYLNGLLGKALVDHLFGDAKTLGEALTAAKAQVLAHTPSPFTQQADFMAGMMQGPEGLPAMRRDGVRHYNLLGDPALRLRRPAADLEVRLAGDTVTVRGPADLAQVTLTLECDRERFAAPLPDVPADAPDRAERLAARWRAANDKVLGRYRIPLANGVGTQKIDRPTASGSYHLKASAPGHIGAATFKVAAAEGF